MPAPHSPEFRERAVALARLGDKPILTLAQELGISRSCLQNWLAQADADQEGRTSSRLTTAEKAELAELRRKNKQLKLENEILKRAAVHSTHQRNSGASLSAGVSNSRVLRGRVFSLRAIRSRSS